MNKTVLTSLAGFVIGVILSGFIASWAVNGNHKSALKAFGIDTNKVVNSEKSPNDMNTSMDDMMATLDGKKGDDFDKAFISEMIVHHQGAIDMAQAAKSNAKHDEIKRMADDIITAQTKEITQMKTWQTEWSYKGNTTGSTDHSMH